MVSATSSARRAAAVLTLAALSAITGIVSYEHGLDVVRLAGNRGLAAYLVPLVPDLMIVTSSLTLIEASAARAARPLMAMSALVAGIGWTTAMNVAAGYQNGPGGAVIAAGTPLAFVLTFESLLWLFRAGAAGAAVSGCDHQPPLCLDEAIAAAYPVLRSQRKVAEAFRVSKTTVANLTTMAGLNGAGHDGA